MNKRFPILGAHMSIAGGYHKAIEKAAALDMATCQIFTKNNNQWRAKPIVDEDEKLFASTLKRWKITNPLSHASYLINLATPDRQLFKKSIDAFIVELQRAEQLGIPYVVVHPGSFTTSSEAAGLKQIARALDEVHRQLPKCSSACLLENTAGQGTNLGWQFEHLAVVLDTVKDPDRVGVCIDTCHAFAAGYPLETKKEFKATIRQLNETVGTKKVKAIHLNDSKREFGSRVDRHEHIGHGFLGMEPFRHLLNDRRFRKIPMYLETPKGENEETGEEWDVVNLRTLRGLIATK